MNNDLILLDRILEDAAASAPAGLSESEAFEYFVHEQVLKPRQLGPDELLSGRIGGTGDGGIDGMFVFLDGVSLDEDSLSGDETPVTRAKKNCTLDIYVSQNKRSEGFEESVIDRIKGTLGQLLAIARDLQQFSGIYSEELLAKANLVTSAIEALATRHPRVQAHIIYGSRGNTNNINMALKSRVADLTDELQTILPNCSADVQFVGARELLELANQDVQPTLRLPYSESLATESSYVVLTRLTDYYDFITDDANELRGYIFESNVRDFQGQVEVNKEIAATLAEGNDPEFWWLNNGVTVIASEASSVGKTLVLEDVQVVNGLQTSVSLYEYLKEPQHREEEKRNLLVRVIQTDEAATRDKVIKATNHQTAVAAASLRAHDPIQRNIEQFFLSDNWYYDRRKNHYRRQGKAADRIVSITYLAQAILGMGFAEPDQARARPTSLIKRQDDYERIFSASLDLRTYLWVARTQKAIDSFLRTETAPGTREQKRDLRFHLGTLLVATEAGEPIYKPRQLIRVLEKAEFTGEELVDGLNRLVTIFEVYQKDHPGPTDRTAKSAEFRDFLLDRLAPTGPSPQTSGS